MFSRVCNFMYVYSFTGIESSKIHTMKISAYTHIQYIETIKINVLQMQKSNGFIQSPENR